MMEEALEPPKNPSGAPDSFLAPLSIDEKNDPIGPCASTTTKRCSDKGFLSISERDYMELLDATARIVRPDKSGATPLEIPPIFDRLKLEIRNWKLLRHVLEHAIKVLHGFPTKPPVLAIEASTHAQLSGGVVAALLNHRLLSVKPSA